MKGIILLIIEPPNNRRIVFKYTEKQLKSNPAALSADQKALLELGKRYPQLSMGGDLLSSAKVKKTEEQLERKEDEDKLLFGISKTFFTELFIPKEENFQNTLFDLTVERNRFISYPYFFEENQNVSKKQSKRDGRKAGKATREEEISDKHK